MAGIKLQSGSTPTSDASGKKRLPTFRAEVFWFRNSQFASLPIEQSLPLAFELTGTITNGTTTLR